MSEMSLGTAAAGWPASGGATSYGRVHMVSRNLDGTRVAEVDAISMTLIRERVVGPGDGAWAAVAGQRGEVFLGLFGAQGQGNLLHLDNGAVRTIASLPQLYVWDLDLTDTGSLVGVGTHPSTVFRVDPRGGPLREIRMLTAGQNPRTCAVVGSLLVVGGSGAGRAFLRQTSLRGSATTSILPPSLAPDETVYCSAATPDGRVAIGTTGALRGDPAVAIIDPRSPATTVVVRLPGESTVDTVTPWGDDLVCTARPSGGVYILRRASRMLQRIAIPVPASETRSLTVESDLAIGVSADGSVWTVELPGGKTVRRSPPFLNIFFRPQRAQSICAGKDKVDVSGSFSLTRHHRRDGRRTVVFIPGEAKAMVDIAGRTYLALYPVGEVWSWAPRGQFPSKLGSLAPGQFRPIGMAHSETTSELAITATDDYQRSVIHLMSIASGSVFALDNALPGQTAAGVTVEDETMYVGGSGEAPSVVAINVRSRQVLWRLDNVVPGGSFILGLRVVGPRLVVTTSRGWVTTIDLATRKIATPKKVAGNSGQLRREGQSGLLLTTGDSLLSVDPVTRTATTRESGLAAEYFNWAPMDTSPDGRTWILRGRNLISPNVPT